MRLVMQKLQVLFVHHRLDGLGNGARVLERLCSRGRGGGGGEEGKRGEEGGEEKRGEEGGGRKGGEEKRYVVGTVSGVGSQERGRRRTTEYVTYACYVMRGWSRFGFSAVTPLPEVWQGRNVKSNCIHMCMCVHT